MPDDQATAIDLNLDVRRTPPWIMGAALITGLTLLVYFPVMGGTYIADDVTYVSMNPLLKSLHGLWSIWFNPRSSQQYYPLVFTTFWLEYRAWGLEPAGYHIVNILLHAANALLLWGVLVRLEIPGAWLAAAIFAVHPVHVESVGLVSERKNILSGFFYLLALWSYIRFAELGSPHEPVRRRWGAYLLALLFFQLALFSKTITSTLPAAIALLIWWKRGRISRQDALALLPLLVLGLLMSFLTYWLEKNHFGGARFPLGLAPWDRIILAGQASWFYLRELFWPHPLAALYDRWPVNHQVARAWLAPICVLLVLAALWLGRRKLGRGPLVALLFFGGTLLPALGFVDLYPMRYSWVADHYQYLASIGPIVLAAAIVTSFVSKWRDSNMAPDIAAAFILLPLCVLTWRQTSVYKDVLTYWKDTIDKAPTAWMAYNNLGGFLSVQRGPDEAAPYVEKALQLNPESPETHLTLAMIRLDQKHPAEALELLNKASRYYGGDSPEVRYHRGRALMNLHRPADAIRELDETIAASPGHAPAYFLRGRILLKMGLVQEAIDNFRRNLVLDPDFVDAYCCLADALAAEKKYDEAALHYQAAIMRAPQFFQAYYNYANMLMSLGRLEDASKMAQQAVVLHPDLADAQNLMGVIYFNLGRKKEAADYFTEAVRLEPTHTEARFNLAGALSNLGQTEAAASQYREILRIDPNDVGARNALKSLQGG
jgi:tetratricopeptide (TPR) repeat protein